MQTADTNISREHLATGRAVDQLRRQLSIVFEQENGTLLAACPVEGLNESLLAQAKNSAQKPPYLLLSGARLRHIAPSLQHTLRIGAVDASNLSLTDMRRLADPLAEGVLPTLTLRPTQPSDETLITLVKYAALLPALLVFEPKTPPADWLRVSAADVAAYWNSPPLDIVPLASAALPMHGAEMAKVTCFRTRYGTSTHLALTFGEISNAPLVRIHSSCITGDILGSLRCDCGDQLHMAIRDMAKSGNGILLYLHQEGRGIGIANKLRAYALQERGVDTYEANLMLGFDEDERDFSLAAGILKSLRQPHIRLMTNNPRKIEQLEKLGITVAERVPVIAPTGAHNQAYIDAKAKKSGHLF